MKGGTVTTPVTPVSNNSANLNEQPASPVIPAMVLPTPDPLVPMNAPMEPTTAPIPEPLAPSAPITPDQPIAPPAAPVDGNLNETVVPEQHDGNGMLPPLPGTAPAPATTEIAAPPVNPVIDQPVSSTEPKPFVTEGAPFPVTEPATSNPEPAIPTELPPPVMPAEPEESLEARVVEPALTPAETPQIDSVEPITPMPAESANPAQVEFDASAAAQVKADPTLVSKPGFFESLLKQAMNIFPNKKTETVATNPTTDSTTEKPLEQPPVSPNEAPDEAEKSIAENSIETASPTSEPSQPITSDTQPPMQTPEGPQQNQ